MKSMNKSKNDAKKGNASRLFEYDEAIVISIQNKRYDQTRNLPNLKGLMDLTVHLEKDIAVFRSGL